MDMNFPHKTLKGIALDEGDAVAVQVADHRALLAHAIARQKSSRSARNYVAASQDLTSSIAAGPTSFIDNRMAFFAGRIRSDRAGHREMTLFESGCFRPDLAHREINNMHG